MITDWQDLHHSESYCSQLTLLQIALRGLVAEQRCPYLRMWMAMI